MFSATIGKYSVSLLRFLFLGYIQAFSYVSVLVSCLKCPYCCFPSHFCFLRIFILLMLILPVSFLVAVISLPLFVFLIYSSSLYINALTLSSIFVSPLSPCFRETVCQCYLGDVRPHDISCSLVNLLKFYPRPFQELSRISDEKENSGLYSFDEIYMILFDEIYMILFWFRVVFWFSWDFLCYLFHSSPLVWSCPFPVFPGICNFPFLRGFWWFFPRVWISNVSSTLLNSTQYSNQSHKWCSLDGFCSSSNF